MEYTIPTYPWIRFVIRWATLIAVAVALGGTLVSVWAATQGLAWPFAAAGVVASLLAGGVVMVLGEVLSILSDTLMPR